MPSRFRGAFRYRHSYGVYRRKFGILYYSSENADDFINSVSKYLIMNNLRSAAICQLFANNTIREDFASCPSIQSACSLTRINSQRLRPGL
jgi:hypothetical protein